MKRLMVVANRLLADISALASIGADGERGIFRSAFDVHEMQAREWFQRRVESAGLEFTVDGAANMHARLGWNDGYASVMTGSHLDTVPGGGSLDGALGVLAGLESLRCLKAANIPLKRPLEVVAFTDEEGLFGGMFGSQALSGQLNQARIDKMCDHDGRSISEAMRESGFDPKKILSAKRDPQSLFAYVELHIEQGPVLEQQGTRLGIVDGIAGQLKWLVELKGKANHAGTTPMHLRQDAFLGLAEIATKIEPLLTQYGTPRTVATIGHVSVCPGASNVIPDNVHFSLDVRDVDNAIVGKLDSAFRTIISSVANSRRLKAKIDELISLPGVQCDDSLMKMMTRVAQDFGVAVHQMPSGAVHDAQNMASLTRAGMIFIPSIGGISHAALEKSARDDVVLGANVLLNVLLELATCD